MVRYAQRRRKPGSRSGGQVYVRRLKKWVSPSQAKKIFAAHARHAANKSTARSRNFQRLRKYTTARRSSSSYKKGQAVYKAVPAELKRLIRQYARK